MNKIINYLKKISKKDIVKVFSMTSISTLVKMLAGFISVKVISVLIGPAGVALVGQLNNFSTILLTLSTGGIVSGITKYISEYKENEKSVKSYIGTAIWITLILSLLCSFFLIISSKILSTKILLDEKFFYVFIIFGITIFFYSINSVLLAIINGFKQFNYYVLISIISSVFGLVLSLFLVFSFGVAGALINAVTSQSLFFFVTVLFCLEKKIKFFNRENIFSKINKNTALQYSKYSIMTIISSFGVPVGQLILRSFLMKKFGIENAGCWEGMNRLSGMYLMVITTSFSVYYMPRLSELSSAREIKQEIIQAYKLLVPCMIIGFCLIYLLKDIIIRILFATEFLQMNKLFKWQLLGDFFKISSWLIAFLMQAKAMVKTFCFTEIFFSIIYVLFGYLFTTYLNLGIEGVVFGYFIMYVLYFIVMYLFVWKKIDYLQEEKKL